LVPAKHLLPVASQRLTNNESIVQQATSQKVD
jgi:hypothetical protein